MSVSEEEDWRSVSDKIIALVNSSPTSDRLRVFQEQLSLLPDHSRRMVEHFVSIALLVNASQSSDRVTMNKNFHISFITVMTLVVAIVLTAGGIYLVSISDDDAVSKIRIFGAHIETSSAGVACLGFAALTYIFTVRSALSKM
ncbi:hypothetical protein [Rhizobium brockwellii]|uniref:hypothetical protein n=1 Tax=Rhizobium brockwellii TaxID=3019932 RepID=UPI00293DA96F|nr:hypothetical protein [Rhizobium brockwellii]MDV4159218.1 hypothetical protein [Rhizobium brockwellii]